MVIRRVLGVVAVALALAPVGAARAGTLGLAEVRGADGTLLAEADHGSFAYPADGSVLRIGSAHANAASVELRDVSMFNGRVSISRILVPARGLVGARVEGLIADGRAYVVGPNALIHLAGGSYLVAMQEAVSPGRHGSGLVGIRAYVSDPSLGLAPGTQLLIGLARAAHPAAVSHAATVVLGLPQLPAAQASMAGVPTTVAGILPRVAGNGLGAQAVGLVERYLGVPYVWGGASPSGFDCSGLVMYVYGLLGIRLPHYSGYQWTSGPHIASDNLQPGDIVFFHASASGPQHEGMYIGGGSFIHAPHTGDVVKISSLFDAQYALSYVGAVRPYVGPARPYAAGASSSPLSIWTSASG